MFSVNIEMGHWYIVFSFGPVHLICLWSDSVLVKSLCLIYNKNPKILCKDDQRCDARDSDHSYKVQLAETLGRDFWQD